MIVIANIFSRKYRRLCDNVEKCGTAGQAADSNITWRMRIACWINKAINTHSEYVILIAFPLEQELQCYVVSTLAVLLCLRTHRTLLPCAAYGSDTCFLPLMGESNLKIFV
jgi:hypothetical protein